MPEKAKTDKSKTPEKSRLQRLKDKNGKQFAPNMPPIACGEHLIQYLWDAGPTMSGNMGEGPLTHAELQAFQANLGVDLNEWEISTLRRLSIDYLNETHRATKADCRPPWGDSSDAKKLQAEEINRKIDLFLD